MLIMREKKMKGKERVRKGRGWKKKGKIMRGRKEGGREGIGGKRGKL